MNYMNEKAPLTIRVNQIKIGRNELIKNLVKKYDVIINNIVYK